MTGALKFWDGTAWNTVGAGPAGPAGAAGPAGPTGATGQWFTYTGSGTPAAGTFSGEKDGDMAVRSSDGEVFKRVGGVWVDQGFTTRSTAATTAARLTYGGGSTSVALAAGTWTKVSLGSKSFDSGSLADTANSRIVIPTSGYYQIEGNLYANAVANSSIVVSFFKNGSAVTQTQSPTSVAGIINLVTSDLVYCAAGDVIELYGQSTVAGAYYVYGGNVNYLSVALITAGPGPQGTGWKQYTGAGSPTITGINGDMAVRTADGEVFQMISGAWADQGWSLQGANMNATYAARAYLGTNQTLAASGWSKLLLNTRSFDPGSNFSLANNQYVCPVAGYYHVDGLVFFSTTITANQNIAGFISRNGVTTTGNGGFEMSLQSAAVQTGESVFAGAGLIQCNAGDTLSLYAYNFPAGLVVGSGDVLTTLSVSLVAATAVQQQPLQPASQARAVRNAALTLTVSAWTKIPVDAVVYDAGQNVSLANGRYVCPVGGYYQIDSAVSVNSAATGILVQGAIYKNGANTAVGSASMSNTANPQTLGSQTSDVVQCNAGDYLELFAYCNAALGLNGNPYTYLAVSLVGTAPTAAPANAARAWRSAALTPAASTWTKISVDTITHDAGGNFSLANGRYVCPVAGVYDVFGSVMFVVSATGTYTAIGASIYRNGVLITQNTPLAAVQNQMQVQVSDKVQCNAGDYIELWGYNAQGAAVTANATTTYLSVSLLTGSQVGPMGPQGVPGNSVDAKTAARAYRAAALTTASGAFSKIPLDTLSYDSAANMQVASGRYVVPTAGYYQANGEVAVAGNASTDCLVHADLYVNGSLAVVGSVVGRMDNAGYARPNVSDVLRLNAGDYIELWTYTSAAFALFVGGASAYNYLSVVKVDTGGPPGPPGGPANQVASPYAITPGYTADRAFSPALTSLGEVANVLATLIDDMKASGLIHP